MDCKVLQTIRHVTIKLDTVPISEIFVHIYGLCTSVIF